MTAADMSSRNEADTADNDTPPPPYESSQLDPSGSLSEPLISRQNTPELDHPHSPRILDRDGPFHQSRGRWSVQRLSSGVRLQFPRNRFGLRRIWDDWFHSLGHQPTLVLMGVLFLVYTAIVFLFAGVYLGVSKLGAPAKSDDVHHSFCGMDINNKMEALYFSLSTMTTIGYGVSDYYFGDCWTPLLLVLGQSCAAITFSAVAIGLLFQRISRGQKRSKTILFSDKAVICRTKGVPYLMFRVGELRRHHLIEASIRAYCLRHERLPLHAIATTTTSGNPCEIETTHYLARSLSLLHPDETLGPHILMSLPQVIVHRLDERSPLVPPRPVWYDAGGYSHSCPSDDTIDREDMKSFCWDREAEIIVLLEGTDELTGSAIQARHSYRVDDILWDHTFAPCVFPYTPRLEQEEEQSRWCRLRHRYCDSAIGVPACSVDFSKFHDIVPVSPDCDQCAYIPN